MSKISDNILLPCGVEIKNRFLQYSDHKASKRVIYVTIQGENEDKDFKVECSGAESTACQIMTVTDLASGEQSIHNLESFDFWHNSLIKLGKVG